MSLTQYFFVVVCCFPAVVSVVFFLLLCRAKQQEKIDSACINILFAQAGKAVFYFDIGKEKIIPTRSFEIVFGKKLLSALNIYEDFSYVVFHDDITAYKKTVQQICAGNNITNFKFRIIVDECNEIWCSLTTTAIHNKHGKPVVIGALENIDSQVREEEQLRFKAERDPLTKLCNKITSEMLVTATLLDRKYKNTINAFLMIDIDNLKQTNDMFGHITGDKIITRLADCIRMVFRESDIQGRVGGDEFVVFMKDVNTKNNALIKAQKMCELYRSILQQDGKRIELSCSIGISIYPDDGTTFCMLYSCADKALYTAKNYGKNQCALYLNDCCAERA
jgi:diguanylate cyclase (GGDEF)-like protein